MEGLPDSSLDVDGSNGLKQITKSEVHKTGNSRHLSAADKGRPLPGARQYREPLEEV
jgi:hypothetical protein